MAQVAISPSKDRYVRDMAESHIACLSAEATSGVVQRLQSAPSAVQPRGLSLRDCTVIAAGSKVTPQDAPSASLGSFSGGRRHFTPQCSPGLPGRQDDVVPAVSSTPTKSPCGVAPPPAAVPPFALHENSSPAVDAGDTDRQQKAPVVTPPFTLHTGAAPQPAARSKSARSSPNVTSKTLPTKAQCRHLQPSRGLWRDLPVYEVSLSAQGAGFYLASTGVVEEHTASSHIVADSSFDFSPPDRGPSPQTYAGLRTTSKNKDSLSSRLESGSPGCPMESAREHRSRYCKEMRTDPLVRSGCVPSPSTVSDQTAFESPRPAVTEMASVLMQVPEKEDAMQSPSPGCSAMQDTPGTQSAATGASAVKGVRRLDFSSLGAASEDADDPIQPDPIQVASHSARVHERRRDFTCPIRTSKLEPDHAERRKQATISVHPVTPRRWQGGHATPIQSPPLSARRCSPNSPLMSPRTQGGHGPTGVSKLCAKMTKSPLGPALRKRNGAMSAR